MEALVSLWLGRAVLLAVAVVLAFAAFCVLCCLLGFHRVQRVIDWHSGRLLERRCVLCDWEERVYRCWSCGSAWRGWHRDGCRAEAEIAELVAEGILPAGGVDAE